MASTPAPGGRGPEPVSGLPAARRSLSVAEYVAELAALLPPDPRSEQVPLDEALGRVLAEPVTARTANPAFDNSAMDGYAVRFESMTTVPVRLRVVGEVAAGSADEPVIGAGECVRIMTGAPLPGSADTVVPVEDTDGGVDVVELRRAPVRRGAHVRLAGEDYPAGVTVAAAGDRLTPGLLGAVAAAGATTVAVRLRPVVAVCATGDELVADGSALGRGQLYESNSHVLAAALRRDGAQVVRGGPVPDQPGALAAWLDEATATADLVVLTGGASVGSHDVVRDLLTERADGVFRHVRVQPGKPQGWARWGDVPVVALPGNPLSAALCYEVFVRPLLEQRVQAAPAATFTAVAATGWTCPSGRAQLLPVLLETTPDGRLLARAAHQRGSASHLVSSLAAADGIAVVAEEVDRVAEGDPVQVRLLV